MSILSEASGTMGSVEDAASKAEIQSSLNFRSDSYPPDFSYRMRAFNKPSTVKWDATFFGPFSAFPHRAVAVKEFVIAVNTTYILVIVMKQL